MPPGQPALLFSFLLVFWCFFSFRLPSPNNDPICWPRAARWAGGTSARREGKSEAPQTHLVWPPPGRGGTHPTRGAPSPRVGTAAPSAPPQKKPSCKLGKAGTLANLSKAFLFLFLFLILFFFFFISLQNTICGGQSEAGLPARAGRPLPGYRLSKQRGRREGI